MLVALQKYFSQLPKVWVDCTLYACILSFTYFQGYFSSDEADKYVSPKTQFYLLCFLGWGATVTGGIKMFLSSSYADHVEQKKASNGNTTFITKSDTKP